MPSALTSPLLEPLAHAQMSARALVDALALLDYSPLAVAVASGLSDQRYSDSIAGGWWQGEYVLEASAWHKAESSVRRSARQAPCEQVR